MAKAMKKVISTIMLIISVCVLVGAFLFYQFQDEKLLALKSHMSLIAFKGKIEYTDSDEEAKRLKEEKKRLEKEEKERLKAEAEAKKQEEKKKKEEEIRLAAEKKQQEEAKKKEEEQAKKNPPKSVLLDVPVVSQLPELKNGCEITSLTMMLNYNGISVDKMTLADKVKKDTTPITYNGSSIGSWGNPNVGFVGDITGKSPGYSIYPEPLKPLVEEYMPGKSLILNGVDYSDIEKVLADKRPVVVWVTVDFKPPTRQAQWVSNGVNITVNLSQHAVLLTGYDENNVYYNDPLDNGKNKSVSKENFKGIWQTMGKHALSYYK